MNWLAPALLFESPAPPALRARLYDVASTLPGVSLARGAHDLTGRRAVEVYLRGTWSAGDGGLRLFFSPRTAAAWHPRHRRFH